MSWHQELKLRYRLVSHLNTFVCQHTRQYLACPFYVRNADADVPAGLRTILRLLVPTTTILTLAHATDEAQPFFF